MFDDGWMDEVSTDCVRLGEFRDDEHVVAKLEAEEEETAKLFAVVVRGSVEEHALSEEVLVEAAGATDEDEEHVLPVPAEGLVRTQPCKDKSALHIAWH